MTIYVVVRENQDDPSDLLRAYANEPQAKGHARELNIRHKNSNHVVKAVELVT